MKRIEPLFTVLLTNALFTILPIVIFCKSPKKAVNEEDTESVIEILLQTPTVLLQNANYQDSTNLKTPAELYFASWFFQYVFAATSATIVSGAVAERVQFVCYVIYSFTITSNARKILTFFLI